MGTTVTDPLVGRLVDSRYEVVSRIARGGMATVYLAVDRRLDRDVALKVMHAHLAEGASGADFVARFRREARTAARLTHPGLVAVYDQGLDGETSYLTMEYVDGANLRRYLGERGALTVGDAFRIGECVLDALATAHRGELVHRDIKPENVLLATDGRVKLADFGLARAVTEVTSTTTGTVLGTVAYLAPELVTRGLSDARTDVYACGILLFEMLTGRQPFTGDTPIQVAFQHVYNDVPAPSELVDWLPIEVDEVVRSLAARDPDDRPLDAGAALALLRRTRLALDEETLDRHADVAPSIVLPAATDPDETDLGPDLEPDVADDDVPGELAADQAETTQLVSDARGATVALPIGLGVSAAELASGGLPDPARRRHLVRWIVALGVLAAMVAGGWWWYGQEGPGAYTAVPTIVRQDEAHATQILERAGLRGKSTKDFSSAPIDEVFATDPGEGSRIRKGATVAFVVSRGPDLVVVPGGVVGALQADAAKVLTDAGLKVQYTDPANADDVAAGKVLSATLPDGSDVVPDAKVNRNTLVTLTISDGPAAVTITSVVNLTVADATKLVAADALKIAPTEVFNDAVPKGIIIDQSPAPATAGHRTDTISVHVSKGPELFPVPDVNHQGVDAATRTLTEAGFQVKTKKAAAYFGLGFVVGQSPSGGDMAPKDAVITLSIT
ncbi:Stk1 family PASTA domain-containing Ser/Thr kinase [Cellulomonas sp. URHD0024]|uniref:Stk1 family PASTA domain-containing Ser/Thr kinase n=1 Tax=Cellulomonas sp. URHD0024 TaxID=1302620 RepID=UPI0004292378|nr:Stk1 family PASTA domain-containing Ser/Thr kinase [Cellulomonas sp. URHD0024]